MSVQSVSSNYVNYVSYESYQSEFFGGTVSTDRLAYLMAQFGISKTDSPYEDMKNLYDAMESYYALYGSYDVQQGSNKTTTDALPWQGIMDRFALAPTGDQTADYNAFMTALRTEQSSSRNINEKNELQNLELYAQSAFFVTQPPALEAPTASALDAAALVNQAFLG